MKKSFAVIAIFLSGFAFSQFKFDMKEVIRPINIKLNKSQADKVTNTGNSKDFIDMKNAGNLKTTGEDYFLSIANPNKTPIHFVTGTANYMNMETVEANTVWQGSTIDLWQNIVIKTNGKQLAYSIRTNNCYAFVWNRGDSAWDLKKIKCDVYEGDEKKKN